jgi:hypothetical protein
MASVGLLLTCLEIAMNGNRDLSPTIYLGSSISKTILSTAALVINAYATTNEWFKEEFNKYYVYVGIACSILIL